MTDPRARFLLTADDKASQTVKKLRGEVDSTTKSFVGLNKFLAGGVAVVGLTKLTTSVAAVVGEAEQAERQMFKLTQLVKATGGAAGLTATEIDDFSRSLARSTLASTEGVRDAAGALLTFKSIGDETFRETLTLAQDLTATMGTDLKGATLQLAKALEDPANGLTALRKSGVSFTESERELIKSLAASGKQLEAQDLILKKVREQVGGTGSAEGKGLSGAVDTLAQNWGELLEKIGKSGPIQAATAAMKSLGGAVEELNRQLFPSERDRFYELIDRRRELLRQINNPTYGRIGSLGLADQELKKVEAELRLLQDRNIARIKETASIRESAKALREESAVTPPTVPGPTARSLVPSVTGLSGADDFAQSFRALEERLDPTIAATRDYTANLALLDEAWARGLVTGDRWQDLVNTLATDTDALEAAQEKLAGQRGRALDLVKGLDPGAGIRDQILEVQKLRDAFPDLADPLGDVEFNLQEQLGAMYQATRGLATNTDALQASWKDLGLTFTSAFEEAIVQGKGLRELLKGIEQDVIGIATRELVTKRLAGAASTFFGESGAGGGFLKSLFGFAAGGSFTVGGSGGTDSQLVAFRASPNERVTVETPSQQRQSGPVYNITIPIQVAEDTPYMRRTARQQAREIQDALSRVF